MNPLKLLSLTMALCFGTALFAPAIELRGRVTAHGRGVAGVAVTDGRTVVRTDRQGRYTLAGDDNARFVYISLPAGYRIQERNHAPHFYRQITDRESPRQRFDFQLETSGDDQRHLFVVWADPQVYRPEELPYISTAAEDVRQLVASYGGIAAHGMVCGDIIGDWTPGSSQFTPIAERAAQSGIPFFYLPGNHDINLDARSNEDSKRDYEAIFGPAYYSFNRGKVHYVMLDNSFFLARSYLYAGYIEERQLRWLEEDLASVPAGSTVVVGMHIPAYSREARSGDWGKESTSKVTNNRKALFKLLGPYKAHICSAHEHYAENYVLSDHLFEHVHAPLSGLFWQTLWSMDGVPWGYTVYEVDGDQIAWYYKAVGQSREVQFSVYGVGEDPLKPESVTVNVWNYDPAWKVCWYENGEPQGAMTRYTGYDATICREVEANRDEHFRWKYIGAGPTEHLFYATPSAPDARIEVEVTDRFGKLYRWSNR